MIFSRFGCKLTITADCGEHKAKGFPRPVQVVRATRADDGAECYYFAHFLRADGGFGEIQTSINAATKIDLTKAELKTALNS